MVSSLLKKALWIIAFLALASLFVHETYPLPSGVHSWAQADRYALACQYQKDGNFFHPATYSLMSEEGRVGVEFPIIPWVSAQLSHVIDPIYQRVFGGDSLPWLMRLVNFLILFFSLIWFSRCIRGNQTLNITAVMALFLSPLLLFYGFNFLPDTTGLAFTLVAFGHLFNYQNLKSNTWWMAVLWSGLATLVKTSSGIYFISIVGILCLYGLLNDRKFVLKVIGLSALIALVIVAYDYYFFYQFNTDHWAVIFMSESQPLKTMNDFHALRKALLFWFGQWITIPQVILLVLIVVAGRWKSKRSLTPTSMTGQTLLLAVIGVVLFLLLMGKQFVNHDYYFVAVFTPLIFLLAGHYLNDIRIHSGATQQTILQFLAIVILVITGLFSFRQYDERSHEHFEWRGRTILNETNWMRQGGDALTSLGVHEDAKIFVLYEFAPNTPLVYFNRMGRVLNHEEMTRDEKNIAYWSNRIEPNYVIVQPKWQSHIKRDQPEFFKTLTMTAESDKLILYKTQNHK